MHKSKNYLHVRCNRLLCVLYSALQWLDFRSQQYQLFHRPKGWNKEHWCSSLLFRLWETSNNSFWISGLRYRVLRWAFSKWWFSVSHVSALNRTMVMEFEFSSVCPLIGMFCLAHFRMPSHWNVLFSTQLLWWEREREREREREVIARWTGVKFPHLVV